MAGGATDHADCRVAAMQTLISPVDVRIDDSTVLQPDVLVVPRSQVGERFVRHPALAVEVLSPRTHSIDPTLMDPARPL